MGEGSIARSMLVLGLLSAFIALLYSGTGLQGPPTPFNPTFPTFNNPFSHARVEFLLTVVGDGPSSFSGGPATAVNNVGIDSCTNGTLPTSGYWGCVATEDAGSSYVTTSGADNQFSVNLSAAPGVPVNLPVLSLVVISQCKTPVSQSVVDFDLLNSAGTLIADVQRTCSPGSWTTDHFVNDFVTPHPVVGSFSSGGLAVVVSAPNNAQVSYLAVDILYGTTPECVSGDTLSYVGCIIAGAVDFLVKLGSYGLNGLLFIAGWLITIGQYLANMAAIIVWLYAIPGMPVEIQLFLDAALTAMMGIVFFKMAGLVRGIGIGI